jgi:endo-1,3-1,4-beta-glycanase ExoK
MRPFYYFTFFLACTALFCAASAFAADMAFKETFPHLDSKRWYVSSGWSNGDHQSCEWRAEAISVAGNNMRMILNDHGGQQRPIGCAEMHTKARNS